MKSVCGAKGRLGVDFPRFHENPQPKGGFGGSGYTQSSTLWTRRGRLWIDPAVMHSRSFAISRPQIIQMLCSTYPRVIHNLVDNNSPGWKRERGRTAIYRERSATGSPREGEVETTKEKRYTNSASSVRGWESGGMDVWTYFASILRITSGAGCPHTDGGRHRLSALPYLNPASGFGITPTRKRKRDDRHRRRQ